MKRFLFGGVSMIALATAAMADGGTLPDSKALDKYMKSLEPAITKSMWNGCTVGGQAGYTMMSTEIGIVDEEGSIDGVGSRGGIGGVHVGCGGVVGGMYLGAWGDYNFSNAEFSALGFEATLDSQWAVGAKFGMPMNNVMPYVIAGYTQAELDWNIPEVGAPTFQGWLVGGGLSWRASKSLSIDFEGRYVRFDEEVVEDFVRLQPTQAVGFVRLNYHFGQ